jgi:DNA repair exonuclease SbcCD ATPase subunit
MWLKRIELKNFKRFVDFQAQFSPGINVVKGPRNEMGKSTLLEGIIAALFRNPKSTAKELKDYVSWGSTRQFQTSLEFEDKGNRYLLEKDFDKGTVRLIDDSTREELDTFKEISEKMAELLGTNSDNLFLCASCIRQAKVREISSGKKEINESLEEIVTGGEESTLASQVMQKLDSKIAETKRGLDKLAKNPGILASLRNKLQDTSRRYNEVRDEVSKVEAQKIELVEVNKQLAEVKEQYENAKALLDKNKQRKEIEASIERLTKETGRRL